ncbi:MAG: T9SS type A sorting domain-containing protein [Candidatus Eisenbacteria sp.]|nr:T9SS type A sorting domain-containing protein [Candidatus Eisenbacteria bacterium]
MCRRRTRRSLLFSLVPSLLVVLSGAGAPALATLQEDWVVHYDAAGYDDHGRRIACDAAGDIYVAGKSHNGSDYDYVVLKYDGASHVLLWDRIYDGGSGDDVLRGLAVSTAGVFVTGESWNGDDYDYLTLGLDPADGSLTWQKRYDGGRGDDEAYAVAVDGSDVYVTGESRGLLNDNVLTVRYDAASGSQGWTASYNGGLNDYATAITVDDAGNIYIAGGTARSLTGLDFLTVKYNASGTEQWTKRKDGAGTVESDPDLAWDIAVAGSTVYVIGQMNGFLGALDYGTVAYRTSDGYERWVATHDGPANGIDIARAIAVDAGGRVWVTGTSLNSASWGQSCIVTIQYDTAGAQQCLRTHCSGMPYATEEGRDVAIDALGRAHVAGRLYSPSYDYDYSLEIDDLSCGAAWSDVYDRAGGDDDAYAIAIDGDAIYVTGESWDGGEYDITTIKYRDVQEITVLEPNGGEQWYVGTEHEITWSSSSTSGVVAIDYTTNGDDPSPTWQTLVASTADDGSYPWEVPLIPDEPADRCQVRVFDTTDGDPEDTSSGYFEIYRFTIGRDGYGFNNTSYHSTYDEVWPPPCWEDYSAYPYTEWPFFDWEAAVAKRMEEEAGDPYPADYAFPSWPMFVDAFGEAKCYFNPPPGNVWFRPSAVLYWLQCPKMHYGSCFGFSLSSCLVFNELVSLGALFPGYSQLYDVPAGGCNETAGKMTVNRYHARMFGAQHLAHQFANILTTGPTETLNAVRAMLAGEERNHRFLAMWRDDLQMAHYIVPVKTASHPTDPDIEYLYTYENFYAGDETIRYTINTATDSWDYVFGGQWHGQGRGIFLMDETASYLSQPPLLPYEYSGDVQITANPQVGVSFQPLGRQRGCQQAFQAVAGATPFSLEDGAWACEFDSLGTGSFSWGVFTDAGTALSYERDGVTDTETDEMYYEGDGQSVVVENPSPAARTHSMSGLKIFASEERLCAIEHIGIAGGGTLRYEIQSDGGLRVENAGDATGYDLRALIASAAGYETFTHEGVSLGANTAHRVHLNWLDHGDQLSVDIDLGINGSVDETIWLLNQEGSAGGPSPCVGSDPDRLALSIAPYPAARRAVIVFFLPAAGPVRLEIFDLAGRRVALLADRPQLAGRHRMVWEAGDQPAGLYFCRIAGGGEQVTKRLVILQ